MKNKIVIITFETYLQEAHPHSLETMEYIAENYDMIEEFKIVEMSGMIVKDESEVSSVSETRIVSKFAFAKNVLLSVSSLFTGISKFCTNVESLVLDKSIASYNTSSVLSYIFI